MRKEYNDRQNAVLVNPGITLGEYEAKKVRTCARCFKTDCWHINPNEEVWVNPSILRENS